MSPAPVVDPDGERGIDRSSLLEAWKRRMWRRCFVLMPAGLVLVLVGSFAWTAAPMGGFLVGALGLFAIVLGALCAKFAAAGPYPGGLQ